MSHQLKNWMCEAGMDGCHSNDEAMDWAADEIARLRQWVDDLHSGMFINCVYCGHRYGPREGTPVSMAYVLKEHIEQCPEHPLSHANAELARLRAAAKPFLDEAWGESDYMHETWNPDAHVDLTMTIEECRQLHRATGYDPRPDPGKEIE